MAVKKKSFKIGDKIIIVANNSGHSIPLNTVCTLNRISGTNYYTVEYPNMYLRTSDFKEGIQTLEDVKTDLETFEALVEETKAKLAFMKANKLNEFDPDQFKVYAVLKTLDSKSSLVEKSKVIAELIKQ